MNLKSKLKKQYITYIIYTPYIKTIKITNQKNIKKKNIIIYLKHNIKHYKIILKIKKFTNTSINYTITYTTSYTNKSHKLIKTNHITFQFKNTLHKLNFTSSKYKIYHFKYIIKHTKKLINIKIHKFFIKQYNNFPI